MSFDYAKHYPAIGQIGKNTCWAASISWWLQYMALGLSKRKWIDQQDLIKRFSNIAQADGSMSTSGIRKVTADSEIRMTIDYVPATEVMDEWSLEEPVLIIYNYPLVGGTHMNIVFNRNWEKDTVQCMEPYYPFPGTDGSRTGRFVTRPLSHFTSNSEIGIGYESWK